MEKQFRIKYFLHHLDLLKLKLILINIDKDSSRSLELDGIVDSKVFH